MLLMGCAKMVTFRINKVNECLLQEFENKYEKG